MGHGLPQIGGTALAEGVTALQVSVVGLRNLEPALSFGGDLRAAAPLALEPDNEQAMGLLAYAYAKLKDKKRAEELIQRLTDGAPRPDTYSALAKAYLGLQENDKALGALERALIRHEPFFTSEPLDSPIFAPIKDEQRLADIRAKVGL